MRFSSVMAMALGLAMPATAGAQDFPDKADIFLVAADGAETRIGTVAFSAATDGSAGIAVQMDGGGFSDHFLSMRPFRCLTGGAEWTCHLPYPYGLRNVVGADDLTDLEYSLLFIRKKPAEFGIDAWNGLYYDLERQPDGTIAGTLLEGDLNSLASPPADAFARPIDASEFVAAKADKRAYPRLVIR